MPASKSVETLVAAISEAFANFSPESIVPEVQGILEHSPEIFTAIADGWRKLAEKTQEELPLSNTVSDEMLEMVPQINALADRARSVHITFTGVHHEDLERHYNGRTNEQMWNVPQ